MRQGIVGIVVDENERVSRHDETTASDGGIDHRHTKTIVDDPTALRDSTESTINDSEIKDNLDTRINNIATDTDYTHLEYAADEMALATDDVASVPSYLEAITTASNRGNSPAVNDEYHFLRILRTRFPVLCRTMVRSFVDLAYVMLISLKVLEASLQHGSTRLRWQCVSAL